MRKHKLLKIISVLLFSMNTYAETPVIPVIPVVSAAKAKANLAPVLQVNKKQATKLNKKFKGQSVNIDRSKLMMQPGVNEIVQVAQGHLNRIVTPFENPKVTSTSPATTEARDNVIYIGTSSTSPVTIFITEKGSEDLALSLTLIPKQIPPREIFLSLGDQLNGAVVTTRAKKWEESQPYIASLESLFKSLALSQLPKGYQFTKDTSDILPNCRQAGLKFNFKDGQTVLGHHFIVHIGVAENKSTTPIEFIESTCGDWDIAAVSAFPRVALNPGERTEVYVIQKRNYKREIKVTRPSLLMGGL